MKRWNSSAYRAKQHCYSTYQVGSLRRRQLLGVRPLTRVALLAEEPEIQVKDDCGNQKQCEESDGGPKNHRERIGGLLWTVGRGVVASVVVIVMNQRVEVVVVVIWQQERGKTQPIGNSLSCQALGVTVVVTVKAKDDDVLIGVLVVGHGGIGNCKAYTLILQC